MKKGIHLIPHVIAPASGGLNAYQKMLAALGMSRPPSFAYADAEGVLLPGLTIEENILIDSLPISLYREKHFQLGRWLEQNGNRALLELFAKIEHPQLGPDDVSPMTRKLAVLIKTLLRDAHCLFFDFPERHLDPSALALLMQALELQVQARSQLCFITSDQEITWRKVASAVVALDEDHRWTLGAVPKAQLIGTFLPEVELEQQEEVRPSSGLSMTVPWRKAN